MFPTKKFLLLFILVAYFCCTLAECKKLRTRKSSKSSPNISATFKTVPYNTNKHQYKTKRSPKMNFYNNHNSKWSSATPYMSDLTLPPSAWPLRSSISAYPRWYTTPMTPLRKYDMQPLVPTMYATNPYRRSDNIDMIAATSAPLLDISAFNSGVSSFATEPTLTPLSSMSLMDFNPLTTDYSGILNFNERMDDVFMPVNRFDANTLFF